MTPIFFFLRQETPIHWREVLKQPINGSKSESPILQFHYHKSSWIFSFESVKHALQFITSHNLLNLFLITHNSLTLIRWFELVVDSLTTGRKFYSSWLGGNCIEVDREEILFMLTWRKLFLSWLGGYCIEVDREEILFMLTWRKLFLSWLGGNCI